MLLYLVKATRYLNQNKNKLTNKKLLGFNVLINSFSVLLMSAKVAYAPDCK